MESFLTTRPKQEEEPNANGSKSTIGKPFGANQGMNIASKIAATIFPNFSRVNRPKAQTSTRQIVKKKK
jgi:hypothetical protein